MNSIKGPILIASTFSAAYEAGGAIDLLNGFQSGLYNGLLVDNLTGDNALVAAPAIAMTAIGGYQAARKNSSGLSRVFGAVATVAGSVGAAASYCPPTSLLPLFVTFCATAVAGVANVAAALTRNHNLAVVEAKKPNNPTPPSV